MGTKLLPGQFDCYYAAEADEPMFVLLGRDRTAAALVRAWAFQRRTAIENGMKPESDRAMVEEALTCAEAMDAFAADWRLRKAGR